MVDHISTLFKYNLTYSVQLENSTPPEIRYGSNLQGKKKKKKKFTKHSHKMGQINNRF